MHRLPTLNIVVIMGYTVSFILSLVIFFPLVSWLLRYKNMEPGYWPFLWLVALAAITEITSRLCIYYFRTNEAVINIYSLAECMLIIYQFYIWRKNKLARKWIIAIGVLFILVWVVENIIAGTINNFVPVFRISYAFLLVIISINEINYLITHENRGLLTNARFLICLAFIIFFLYQILFEAAFRISINQSSVVTNKIFEMQIYINLLVNVIYGVAIWFIPRKGIFDFTKSG